MTRRNGSQDVRQAGGLQPLQGLHHTIAQGLRPIGMQLQKSSMREQAGPRHQASHQVASALQGSGIAQDSDVVFLLQPVHDRVRIAQGIDAAAAQHLHHPLRRAHRNKHHILGRQALTRQPLASRPVSG